MTQNTLLVCTLCAMFTRIGAEYKRARITTTACISR